MARSADRLLRSTAAAATPGRWLGGRGAPWRGSVRDGAAFWLATQAALIVFTWVAVIAVTNVYNHGPTAVRSRLFLESWARWDGAFYLQIAQAGYTQAPQTPFFPFYPLLARALGTLFSVAHRTPVPELWGGLLASHLSCLVAFVAIAALARRELGAAGDAWRSLVLLAAYPFSFFLAAVYPQATFLAAATLALLAARSGWWPAAAACAYVAALTHQTGMALVLPLAWEFARHERGLQIGAAGPPLPWRSIPLRVGQGVVMVAAAPLGVLTYLTYLWRDFGDPLLPQKVEAALWGRHLTPPWETAALYWGHLRGFPLWTDTHVLMVLEGGAWLGFAVLTVVLVRRQPFMCTLYVAGLLLLCVVLPATSSIYFDNPITGTGRFLIGAVPGFIGLAGLLRERHAVLTALVGSGVAIQGILAAYFFVSGFVA